MASNFSHPGRNIGAVTGFQSQQQTPEPPYSPPSSISPHPTLVQQQQYETSVYAQAPLEFYQPMYADPYRAAAATTPFHTIQTQSQYPPYQGNRHFSPIKEVLAFNIGKEMSQGLYQPHEAATVDTSFNPPYMQAPQHLAAELQRPSNGLVASRWADPAASTNPPPTPVPKKSPLETFISKSQGRGISIKPAEAAVDTASNGNANSNARSVLSNTNTENIPPKAVGSSNGASTVTKQIDGNHAAAKAQAMTRSVGLAASKWA
ncbi:hypothetical protein KEM55_007293 [Ascosphaera atra]|nr:hypothetical protein KEM55_007293 [Ascosphaera atra]